MTTIFIYDFDGNIIAESDESGSFSREYLYNGSNRMAMVDVSTGEFYYYLNDQLGTPQMMVDSTNTVVWESIYRPYGEGVVNPHSGVTSHFRFPGQYFDVETGFHYNYHRYYEPRTGRYLRADPIHLVQPKGSSIPYLHTLLFNTSQDFNLFLYGDGNPIMNKDVSPASPAGQ